MLTRHAIQVLRQAGHEQRDMAELVGVGVRTVRRVDGEPDVADVDTEAERERRGIGRPAKAEPFRSVVAEIWAGEPDLLSVEILRRVKLRGDTGGRALIGGRCTSHGDGQERDELGLEPGLAIFEE